MKYPLSLKLATLSLAVLLAGSAAADTLLADRVHATPANAPARGQTDAEVEAKFGAPTQKLEPQGGQKKQWPQINRWVYPQFTVYFEKSKVIDVVANQASAEEVGPKPAPAQHAAAAQATHKPAKKHKASPKAQAPTAAAPAASGSVTPAARKPHSKATKSIQPAAPGSAATPAG